MTTKMRSESLYAGPIGTVVLFEEDPALGFRAELITPSRDPAVTRSPDELRRLADALKQGAARMYVAAGRHACGRPTCEGCEECLRWEGAGSGDTTCKRPHAPPRSEG